MATTPDYNDVENDPPTVTDHPGDLTSISEPLAVLERALTTVPTLINLPASSTTSLTVIQGRLRCGPYFLLHTSILLLYWYTLSRSLVRLILFMSVHVVLLFLLPPLLLLLLLLAAPYARMHFSGQARHFKYGLPLNSQGAMHTDCVMQEHTGREICIFDFLTAHTT